jgi:hypothetical protein
VRDSESTGKSHTKREENSTIKYGYSIPDELRQAAKLVAESTPPSPSTGNHSAIAALMDEKYGTGNKDTHVPVQAFRTYNGLSQIVLDKNDTMPVYDLESEESLEKRSAASWWMAIMTQRGNSPYAPSGYKVSWH